MRQLIMNILDTGTLQHASASGWSCRFVKLQNERKTGKESVGLRLPTVSVSWKTQNSKHIAFTSHAMPCQSRACWYTWWLCKHLLLQAELCRRHKYPVTVSQS